MSVELLADGSAGRADLVRAWAERGDVGLGAMARLLGYRESERRVEVVERVEGFGEERPRDQDAAAAPSPEPREIEPPKDPSGLKKIPFWYVEEMEVPEPRERPTKERKLDDVEPIGLGGIGRLPGKPPETPPIVAEARLLPVLRRRFSSDLESRQVDVAELIERWSRGRQVRRLPFRPLAAWTPRLYLVIDRSPRLRPFWDDQDRLARRLGRLLGEVSVREIVFRESDLRPWGGARDLHVEPGAQVLVLGDLGFLAGDRRHEFWRAVGLRLRRLEAYGAALLTCPPDRWDRWTLEAWNAIEWERPFGRRSHSPSPSLEDREENAERLLTLVSFASRIELGLLRAVRRFLPAYQADLGTELDVVDHSGTSGFSAFGLDSELRLRLQARFAELDDDVKAGVVAAMRDWRSGQPGEIWLDEVFGLFYGGELPEGVLTQGEIDAAKHLWRRISRTSLGGESEQITEGIRGFANRALGERLPLAIWGDEEIRDALWVAWKESWKGDGLPPLPSGFGPGLFGDEGEPRAWSAWQVGGDICFFSGREEPEFGVRLFEFEAGATSVAFDGDERRFAARSALVDGLRAELPESELLTLRFDRARVVLRRVRQPDWASAIWRDRRGIWAVRDSRHGKLWFSPRREAIREGSVPENAIHWEGIVTRPDWASYAGRDEFGIWAHFKIGEVVQKMRFVPPGHFLMGSPESELGRYDDEGPRRLVTIEPGFWLGETPCTQALWMAVMETNPSRFLSPERPVEKVSWSECHDFFERLAERLPGFEGRLPTEAEWEYACRAGSKLLRYGELDAIAWHQKNSGGQTRPVSLKQPNLYGLYDMLGNVNEWCSDWFSEYSVYNGVINPIGPELGARRVARGGSWNNKPYLARAAFRHSAFPQGRWSLLGFRIAHHATLQGFQA